MNTVSSEPGASTVVRSDRGGAGGGAPRPARDGAVVHLGWMRDALSTRSVGSLDAMIVTKSRAGFDRGGVQSLAWLLEVIAGGAFGRLKYLVFDFAHPASEESGAAEGFEALVAANARLILDAPVITLAWARSAMAGADLDFALHCSMMVAERGSRFSFDGEPAALLGLYAALARRIGFVKTERLIESGARLGSSDMRDMCLVKDVVETRDDAEAIEDYVRRHGRRYNASCAIFQAQSMAMAPIDRRFAGGPPRRGSHGIVERGRLAP